jgi:hypothetical protein
VPTPSKKKDIVLEQVVKGFKLVLHRKKDRIFLREGFLVYKMSGGSFPSRDIQGACNFFK